MAQEESPHETHHRLALTVRLRPGEAQLLLPGELTPTAADPLLVARSPDAEWRVMAHLHLHDGAFFMQDLNIVPWDGYPLPMGTEVLRRLPLARWLTQAHSWLAERAQGAMNRGDLRSQVQRLARSKVTPAAGRRGYPADYYRRLAMEYLELQSGGMYGGIRAELAKRETRRQKRPVTPDNIRDAISRATELGFLARGEPGRPGRMPGPNLYEPGGGEAPEGSER